MTSSNKTIVIAEAGVNHNGSMELAKKLIDVASEAGADFVKFQSFKADRLVTKNAKKAQYQKDNMKQASDDDKQYQMLKKLELSDDDHDVLIEYCQSKDVEFLSTPFDEESADFLEEKVSFFKIPSGELTNQPFLKHIALKRIPIVLSTGMGTIDEVAIAVSLVRETWNASGGEPSEIVLSSGKKLPALTVLHCTTSYPTPLEEVNLLAIETIKSKLNIPVGYSDHTLSVEVPSLAVCLGATVIEKHFTLDRNMGGPDHAASLVPEELVQMVSKIREAELILGTGIKSPSKSEKGNIDIARKSIFFSRSLEAGKVLQRDDFSIKRPGDGLAPKYLGVIIGKKLKVSVEAEDYVKLDDLI